MNESMAMLLMKASRLITDYPPSAVVASPQLSLNCLATLLISFPSLLSKSINLPTHSAICSRINRFSHVPISFFILFPIFQFPTIWLLLGCWSKEKRKSEHRSASIKIFKMELDPTVCQEIPCRRMARYPQLITPRPRQYLPSITTSLIQSRSVSTSHPQEPNTTHLQASKNFVHLGTWNREKTS